LEKAYKTFFESKNRSDIDVLTLKSESYDTPLILSIELDSMDIFNYLISEERRVDLNTRNDLN